MGMGLVKKLVLCLVQESVSCFIVKLFQEQYEAAAQWYNRRTAVLEVSGSIPPPVIVELL